jgi:hypothetical protein
MSRAIRWLTQLVEPPLSSTPLRARQTRLRNEVGLVLVGAEHDVPRLAAAGGLS